MRYRLICVHMLILGSTFYSLNNERKTIWKIREKNTHTICNSADNLADSPNNKTKIHTSNEWQWVLRSGFFIRIIFFLLLRIFFRSYSFSASSFSTPAFSLPELSRKIMRKMFLNWHPVIYFFFFFFIFSFARFDSEATTRILTINKNKLFNRNRKKWRLLLRRVSEREIERNESVWHKIKYARRKN